MTKSRLLTAWRGTRQAAFQLRDDTRGLSAVEFAVILPMMLVLFFGLVEISNGVAADRKVTLTARALSDLISQAITVTDTDINESFSASKGVMAPFDTSTIKSVVSEVKIDSSGNAKIAWSKANANASARPVNSSVTIPASLAVPNTYLIWSEVSYDYKPAVGYVVSKATGIPLKEEFFTRPRQSNCVLYGTASCP
ncbi:MAG: TadE/TadG family type IV pilus assembly protein [Pseudomonadota bacterium]